jgi:uncharacterized membrane protein YciS (DUF1049 family)
MEYTLAQWYILPTLIVIAFAIGALIPALILGYRINHFILSFKLSKETH